MMQGVCTIRPSDDCLAGVFAHLDPALVLEALRHELVDVPRETRCGWRHIVALDAAYHSRRYIRVAYALLSDPQTPAERVWPEGDLMYLHAPPRPPMSRRGRIIRLGGESFEVYRFPNDRRLRGLRKFAAAGFAATMWQRWIDQSDRGGVIDANTLQRRFLRYVPEEKWIVRLRAEVTRGENREVIKRRIAVRCSPPASSRRLAQRHVRTTAALAENADGVRVPGVVGFDPANGILAVEWDRGDPLLEGLAHSAEAMAAFVRALRTFHAAPVAELPPIEFSRLADSAFAMVQELSLACPGLSGTLADLVAELARRLGEAPTESTVTLHNDLHPRQVLIRHGRFAFLDLERMGQGDPLIDVANFTAQLGIAPYRPEVGIDQALAARLRDSFLRDWLRDGGAAVDDGKFRALCSASFLKLAHGAMRHLRPRWNDTVQTCLRLAEAELGGKREQVSIG